MIASVLYGSYGENEQDEECDVIVLLCSGGMCGDMYVGLKCTVVSNILFSVTVCLSLICLPSLYEMNCQHCYYSHENYHSKN